MAKSVMFVGAVAVAALAVGTAEAASKAKYYESCAASVTQARALVPAPPPDIAGTAKKASDVANVVGKIPGLGGLGGFGGFGSKAASTAQQVAKYSDIIADAAQFTAKMKQDYPDSATRLAAYGDRMSADADKVTQASDNLDTAADCYGKAYEDLKAGVAAKEIKDAKDRQKEIQSGVDDMASIASDARTTMNTNIKSYNDALNGDTQGMGLKLGDLVSVAGAVGVTPTSVVGLPKVPGVADTPEAQAQAYQIAAAAQQNGYSANNTQAQNYAALARTQGQINAGALPAIQTGGSAAAGLGTLGSLSRFSALSAGPMGGANIAAEVASAARSGGSAAVPVTTTVVAEMSPEMLKSLNKVGGDSTKYMGTFDRLNAQSEKFSALKATAGAKLD